MPDDDTISEPGTVIDLDADPDQASTLMGRSHRKMRLEIEGDDDGSWFRVPRGWLPLLPSLPPATLRVALCLASHANRQWLAWPGRERVMQLAGVKNSAYADAINALRDGGYITRRKVRMGRRVFRSWLLNGKPVKPAEAADDRTLFEADAPDPPPENSAVAEFPARRTPENSATADSQNSAVAENSATADTKTPQRRTQNRIREQNNDVDDVLFARLAAEGFDRSDAAAIVARVGPDKVQGILLKADEMERTAAPAKPAFRKSRFHWLAWAFSNPQFVSVESVQARSDADAQRRLQSQQAGDAIRAVRAMPADRLSQLWGQALAQASDDERAAFKRAPEVNAPLAIRIVELAGGEA